MFYRYLAKHLLIISNLISDELNILILYQIFWNDVNDIYL